MRKSEKLLRNLIREIHLNEMQVATMTLRDTTDPEAKITGPLTSVLRPSDSEFLVNFMAKKDRRSKLQPFPEWLEKRLERIKYRLAPEVEALARMILTSDNTIASGVVNLQSVIGPMINGAGQEVSPPAVPAGGQPAISISIPAALAPLALAKKSTERLEENTGAGEALAILLYGRDASPSEPDLAISTVPTGGFSIKYFREESKTTKTGGFEPVGSSVGARASYRLVELARNNNIRYGGGKTSNQVTRRGMSSIISQLTQLAGNSSTGTYSGKNITDIWQDISDAQNLWNNISCSKHPMLALCGTGAGLTLKILGVDQVKLGTLRWGKSGSNFAFEIAHPDIAANVQV